MEEYYTVQQASKLLGISVSCFKCGNFTAEKVKNMNNKELAKELLGYTYIDIQKIPETYRMLNIDIEKFKKDLLCTEYSI